MDLGCNWEQKALVNELIQGIELAKQLRVELTSASSSESREALLQRILSSYDKALLILKWSGSVAQPQPAGTYAGVPNSSVSADVSPRSEDFERGFKDVSKKRKLLPTWTKQVRVGSENGLDGATDDGYSWRKYGQKDILGATYPRSYYRCTYRNTQSCWATKQVQRSEEDPTIFEITYRGKHTCHQASNSVAPPASPEKQELKKHIHHQNYNQQQQSSNDMLLNLRANLRVNVEEGGNTEMASPFSLSSASFGCMTSENPFSMLLNGDLLGSFSPSFISPAASESNYYSVSPCQMDSFGQFHNLQPKESEIISANTSATNSPIGDLDFSIDPVDLNPNFPFDSPGFFD
ncbi:hypothetical protein RJ640_019030 [Escallonia rubra]|uniref:WRKY domain-containing protein n=1 Tax=Escallonia rubra TaxID=112253 RepID=A0AA88QKV3_9ASTE|nr:hypothetical protein RJ640_019030 [Escallonia rubra]